ncbi:MAG: hypothetical protein AAGB32_00135 [Pseudomonadota bacterium]
MRGKQMLFEKKYLRLQDIKRNWGITQEDLYYAIENGLLRASIWLPLRWMEIGKYKETRFQYERHEHVEGFVSLRQQDCHTIFSQGCTQLRIFRSIDEHENILRLAYEPPQPDIAVRINDLIILKEHKEHFESKFDIKELQNIKKGNEDHPQFEASNDYRHVILDEHEFHFGDVQARIVSQLHDAALSRNPWVHGKTLIAGTNSRSSRMRDIFKKKEIWNHLIVSNQRGSYRLNLPLYYEDNEHVHVAK